MGVAVLAGAVTSATRAIFRVLGTTDEVTECELCGRTELKGTVILALLDEAGGDTGCRTHCGSSCAAMLCGWSVRDVGRLARAADRDAANGRRAAYDAAWADYRARETAARVAWLECRPDLHGLSIIRQMTAFEGTPEYIAVRTTAPELGDLR